ncbi:MAG: S-layer homology domain-containing protein [Lawsonibacter sp.]|nr:S-layer homology domain-containing protein [Lawsonibacter sp.]
MKLNRRFFAVLLALCMMLGAALPVSAAELNPAYGEASYYDIAVASYSRMLMFQNGVVAAADASKQYGLIDAAGSVVVPFQYAGVWALGGGLFKVCDQATGLGGNQGIIDSTGKEVLPMGNHFISSRNQTIQVDGDYYTLDMKPSTSEAFYGQGKAAAQLAAYDWYTEAYGYYVVQGRQAGDSWAGVYGVLDSSFKTVVPMQDGYISVVSDGATTLFLADDKVYGTSGQEVSFSGLYDSVQQDWNGSAVLWVQKDDQTGAIDFTGKVLVPLGHYAGVGGLNQQGYIAAYSEESGASLVYKDGELVKTFEGKHVATEAYYRDLGFTDSSGKAGIMDLSGKVLIPAEYAWINGDGNGNLLAFRDSGGWTYTCGLYDYSGKVIFSDGYELINHLRDNKYQLYDGAHYGISTLSGSAVVPMKYVDMRLHTLDFIELYDGTSYSVVDLNNRTVVPASSEPINLFRSAVNEDLSSGITRANWYAKEYDGYDKSVLPFCYRLSDGSYATVYADYNTGEVAGTLANRASLPTEDGDFVYQASSGLFGFGTLKGQTPAEPEKPVEPEKPAQGDLPFLDVPEDSWFYGAVKYAFDNKLMSGSSETAFNPDGMTSRAALLSILYNFEDRPETDAAVNYSDVQSQWFAEAASWAKANGLAQGVVEDELSGDTPLTREQMAIILYNFARYKEFDTQGRADLSAFSDAGSVSEGARDALSWANHAGLINGAGGALSPAGTATRAQLASILKNFCQNVAGK